MKRFAFSILLILAAFAPAVMADELPELKDKVVYVAAFKNGLGFFMREGEANLQGGWCMTKTVPEDSHGTFWLAPQKEGARVDQLITYYERVFAPQSLSSVKDLLYENTGKDATIALVGPQGKTFTGKIISVTNMVIMQVGDSTTAVNVDQVAWAEIIGKANTMGTSDTNVPRAKFRITGSGDTCPVATAYVKKGITWTPSYLIELLDDKSARITMQGLLINDIEDLDDVNVSFVVGYPNFMFADVRSPLDMRISVDLFIQSITAMGSSPGVYAPSLGQSVMSNAASPGGFEGRPAFAYSAAANTPGAEEEDLFLYKRDGVTLKKGERAYYDIFQASVPYEHIYEWESPDESLADPYGNSSSNRQAPNAATSVWHKLKLKNNTSYPWTTAPAFTLSNHQPLAQDLMNYTSKGAGAKVKLTVATDIKAVSEEVELGREPVKIADYTYQKVTTGGKLTLTNMKDKPVTVDVKKYVTGEVNETSDKGKSVKSTKGNKAINPSTTLTWSVSLKADEEKTVSYKYITYVR